MQIIILDTETNRLHGEVIQLAYIELNVDYSQHDTFAYHIGQTFKQNYQPTTPICSDAMAVHHIIDSDLHGCPLTDTVDIPNTVEYVIGHNIDYDIDAIKRSRNIFEATCQDGIDEIKRIDTLAIIRYLRPDLKSHKLINLCYELAFTMGVDDSDVRDVARNAHDALADCRLTEFLLSYILNSQEIYNIWHLYNLSIKARIPTHIFYGKYKGMRIDELTEYQIDWLIQRTDDPYLLEALEGASAKETTFELYDDNNNDPDGLPF